MYVCLCIYRCTYLYMYVCMYACMHVCMYVCMHHVSMMIVCYQDIVKPFLFFLYRFHSKSKSSQKLGRFQYHFNIIRNKGGFRTGVPKTTFPWKIKGPDNPTSQLLPKMSFNGFSRDGEGRKDKGGGERSRR